MILKVRILFVEWLHVIIKFSLTGLLNAAGSADDVTASV